MKKKSLAVLALVAVIALIAGTTLLFWKQGNSSPSAKISVNDLKIDAAYYPAVERVEVKHALIDENPDDSSAPEMVRMVREMGIRSSAIYNIWLRSDADPVLIKARVNVFVDAEAAKRDMAKRYSAQARAMSSRMTLGDDSFNLQDRLVAMRIDRVQVELAGRGVPAQLMGLATAYAQLVEGKLGRSK